MLTQRDAIGRLQQGMVATRTDIIRTWQAFADSNGYTLRRYRHGNLEQANAYREARQLAAIMALGLGPLDTWRWSD